MTGTRSDAVARYHRSWRALDRLDLLAAGGPFAERRVEAHRDLEVERLDAAGADYEASLSDIPILRCPLTGVTVAIPIDLDGFDGPWWNYDAPRRPLPQSLPDSFVGLDGACDVSGGFPAPPFRVWLGPARPTVIPEVLGHDGMVAVLATVEVGSHRVVVTGYFRDPAAGGRPPLNAWATDHYFGLDEAGDVVRGSAPDPVRSADLDQWFDGDRLQWIAPGDTTMSLRSGRSQCPYLTQGDGAAPRWLMEGDVVQESDPNEVS